MLQKRGGEREIAAIGSDRVLGSASFGRHHLEETLDQRAVCAGRGLGQSRAIASAAIIRASPSCPTALSAVTMW